MAEAFGNGIEKANLRVSLDHLYSAIQADFALRDRKIRDLELALDRQSLRITSLETALAANEIPTAPHPGADTPVPVAARPAGAANGGQS